MHPYITDLVSACGRSSILPKSVTDITFEADGSLDLVDGYHIQISDDGYERYTLVKVSETDGVFTFFPGRDTAPEVIEQYLSLSRACRDELQDTIPCPGANSTGVSDPE